MLVDLSYCLILQELNIKLTIQNRQFLLVGNKERLQKVNLMPASAGFWGTSKISDKEITMPHITVRLTDEELAAFDKIVSEEDTNRAELIHSWIRKSAKKHKIKLAPARKRGGKQTPQYYVCINNYGHNQHEKWQPVAGPFNTKDEASEVAAEWYFDDGHAPSAVLTWVTTKTELGWTEENIKKSIQWHEEMKQLDSITTE